MCIFNNLTLLTAPIMCFSKGVFSYFREWPEKKLYGGKHWIICTYIVLSLSQHRKLGQKAKNKCPRFVGSLQNRTSNTVCSNCKDIRGKSWKLQNRSNMSTSNYLITPIHPGPCVQCASYMIQTTWCTLVGAEGVPSL